MLKRCFSVLRIFGAICVFSAIFAKEIFATSTVDVNVFVRPSHKIPPSAITDLTASSGSNIGEINLDWTAPQTTWNIDLRWFYIRYSTKSVTDAPFLGDTTAWWNNAPNIYDISNWWKPGDHVNLTLGGLIPAATYYFSIKAEDEFGNVSDFDTETAALNQANARALWDKTPPAGITTLAAQTGDTEGEVKLNWLSPGDDGTSGNLTGKFRIDYATYTKAWNYSNYEIEISTSNLSPLTSNLYIVTGLDGGVTYYFRIWAADEIPNWSSVSNGATACAQVDVTAPAAVTNLTVSDNSKANALQLQWTSPGDDGLSGNLTGQFEIRYSTEISLSTYQLVSLSTSCSAGTVNYYSVTGLKGDTSYYFTIRIADERGNWSPLSAPATGWTLDNVPPQPPTSLVAVAGDMEVHLNWSASVSDDVANYRIYRSADPLSTYQLINLSTATTYADTGLTNLVTYWYFVTAVDFAGN